VLDDAVIHQATGMVLVQLGVDAEAAFARLRGHAYVTGRRLGDVARDVVGRRIRFTRDPPTGSGHDGRGGGQ
jgi:AmiR/NasT family two-component response regulator